MPACADSWNSTTLESGPLAGEAACAPNDVQLKKLLDPDKAHEEDLQDPVWVPPAAYTNQQQMSISKGLKFGCSCLNTEGNSGTKEDKVDIYRRHKICIVIVSISLFLAGLATQKQRGPLHHPVAYLSSSR